MKKVQIGIYLLALVVSVVYLIFVLGFSTNYAVGEGYLGQFYIDAQKANKHMYELAIWLVVLVGVSFLLNTYKNKRFYVSHYVISVAIIAMFVITGITTLGYMGPLKEAYLQVDEFMLFVLTVINGGEISTENFEQGVILSYVLLFQGFLVLLITGYKVSTDIARVKAKKSRNTEVIS
jgi:hypothetical protein